MTPLQSFINRDSEVEELHNILTCNTNVVVTGPVGVGKSELTRKYCDVYLKHYQRLVWIEGQDLEGDIFALLKELDILLPDALQSTMGIQNSMSDAYERLSSDNTLVVFDNIEMNQSLFRYLPKIGSSYPNIKILMTSQDPRWPSHMVSYPLLPLKLVNAFTYLVYNIWDDGSENQKDIKHFLEKVVGRHPLLCQLAAAYVWKHQVTVRQYKELLDNAIEKLPKEQTPPTKDSKFAGAIHAAINIAIDALEESKNFTAIHLLCTLSFLDTNNMETKLLRFFKGDKGAFPTQLLAVLEEYSLIAVHSPVGGERDDVSFTMYSFIRKTLQLNIEKEEATKCIRDLSTMIKDSRRPCTHHLVPLIKRYAGDEDILQILKVHKNGLRVALENEGKYVVSKQVLSSFFAQELKYEFKAGESFMNKGKFGRALEVFEDVLRNQTNHLGDSHPDTVKTKEAIEGCKRRSRLLGNKE